jgi:toxin ParE1/3/4
MTAKAVVRRSQAQKDIENAADWYFGEGGVTLEARFIDALQAAIRRIAINPGVGSARYAALMQIPGLRFWRLTKFPYLIFYVERERQVDVWRVLHEQRDLPRRFAPGSQES